MNTIDVKRGDTLELQCTAQDRGVPIDLTGWQIDSHVRGPQGRLVHTFVATITAPTDGQYLLASAPTTDWPLGGLTMDIRYTDSLGNVSHTETLPLQVQEAVTR